LRTRSGRLLRRPPDPRPDSLNWSALKPAVAPALHQAWQCAHQGNGHGVSGSLRADTGRCCKCGVRGVVTVRRIAFAVLVLCVSGFEIIPSLGRATGQPRPPCAEASSAFVAPMGMASTSDGGLLIVDRGLQALVNVDPTTGACRLISSDRRGAGNPLNAPVGAVADHESYYVIDPGEGAVVRIEPRTGDRSELSGKQNGAGPGFSTARTLARLGDNALAVFDIGLNAVLRVDTKTGDRSIVSSPTVGKGLAFVDAFGMAADGDRLFVADPGLRAILSIDLKRGDRKIVSGPDRGKGRRLQSPTRLLLVSRDRLLVVDAALKSVVSVDPSSGDRSVVSGGDVGAGPAFVIPVDMALVARKLFVVDLGRRAVLAIDPATGDRSIT